MSGKKIIGVLILILALAAIVKAGFINVIAYADQRIDSQIDKWASKRH